MTAAVTLRGVRRTFRPDRSDRSDPSSAPVLALDGVDLVIEEGSFVALIGPSGCGKSTLLRIVAGLDVDGEGSVDVPSVRAQAVAYVFQDAHLLPWRTVAENVALPLQLRGAPKEGRAQAVAEALAAVSLEDAADRHPNELSGGMRMRASIARALVTKPRLLLMDEPFAALDEISRHRLDERLHALFLEQKLTVLFVTHTIFEATYLAERAIVFSKRPGRVVHDAKVELPRERPASIRGEPRFVREAQRLFEALERGSA